MHEFGIMTALLEAVEDKGQQTGAQRVLGIYLVVGERSGIVDESLRFYFDMLSPETLAAGAEIHVRRTSMRFHCDGCSVEYTPAEAGFDCPGCGTYGRLVDDGTQMLIESIEVVQ